jgi:hypothetical protein
LPVHEGYLSAEPDGNGVAAWSTRWEDLRGNVALLGKVGFVEENYRDTAFPMQFLRHNIDATITGTLQTEHAWEEDTEIRLHVHIVPMANGAGNVYWTYSYYFVPIDGNIPAAAGWTDSTTTTALVAGDQYDHRQRSVFSFTPSGGTESSLLLFTLTRESTHVSDTYSTNKDHGTIQANLGLLFVDAHIRLNKPGTLTLLP